MRTGNPQAASQVQGSRESVDRSGDPDTEAPATGVDPTHFRDVLGQVPTSVVVATCKTSHRHVGVTVGSFVSISLEPAMVGFFLGADSESGESFKQVGAFSVNVLAADQHALSGVMASRADTRFDGVEFRSSPITGAPQFPESLAVIDCSLFDTMPVGDHELFVGLVLDLKVARETDPLVFHRRQYGTVRPLDLNAE